MKNAELNLKKQAIQELFDSQIKTEKELMLAKRKIAKKYGFPIFSNAEILKELSSGASELGSFKRLLRKRAVRTMSGIAPVAVLTKPYPCPGKCAYCPTEKDVPQSYLSNEPAVMRAIRCGYNPFVQVQDRLRALIINGHEPTKIELIVIGGTWSYLPVKYKFWYALNSFAAANEFRISNKFSTLPTGRQVSSKFSNTSNNESVRTSLHCKYPISLSLKELKRFLLVEQKKNEKAKYQIIGLTLETRPDYINEKELEEMRILGCTRVELGVQHLDDAILKLNRRGHGVAAIADATRLLKDYGFKVTYHIMPGLPGSTPAQDFKMYRQLFSDERFQPDQIKFYPCVVTKGSLLYHWWKQGKYKPYTDKVLRELIIKCKEVTPEYVRIIRLIRDIPGESIIAGNRITNLRQVMKDLGTECRCIRCREVGSLRSGDSVAAHPEIGKLGNRDIENYKLEILKYTASSGVEYFIQAVAGAEKRLLGFCRLRLFQSHDFSQELGAQARAMVRELHVYGELVPIGNEMKVQHAGLGKILMAEAERIAREAGSKNLAVISGVGVRGYYRKLGFRLEGTYMQKKIRFAKSG